MLDSALYVKEEIILLIFFSAVLSSLVYFFYVGKFKGFKKLIYGITLIFPITIIALILPIGLNNTGFGNEIGRSLVTYWVPAAIVATFALTLVEQYKRLKTILSSIGLLASLVILTVLFFPLQEYRNSAAQIAIRSITIGSYLSLFMFLYVSHVSKVFNFSGGNTTFMLGVMWGVIVLLMIFGFMTNSIGGNNVIEALPPMP